MHMLKHSAMRIVFKHVKNIKERVMGRTYVEAFRNVDRLQTCCATCIC
jgi:hypothetical protein